MTGSNIDRLAYINRSIVEEVGLGFMPRVVSGIHDDPYHMVCILSTTDYCNCSHV